MSTNDIYALAARQHGLITFQQLREFGLADSTIARWVASRRLRAISPSVHRLGGAPDTWHQRVMRATLDTDGWASHRTAAALHGLDGHDGRVIEVVVERWKRSSKHDGYIVRETKDLRPVDLDEVRGIPCTSLVRTLIDLPAVEHPFRAEQALDHACRLDADLLPIVGTRFRQVARRGRNGTTVMRGLLSERTGIYIPPGSTFEKDALRWIDAAGIEPPVKQHQVVDGDFTAYLDLAWPHLLFGMECDSLAFHFSKAAQEWDRQRRRHLKRLGWELAEFSYDEVKSGAFIPELRQLLVLASRTSHMRRG
jgi:predicted transcriptional regulator of viral defense system